MEACTRQDYIMGTIITQKIYAEDSEIAADKVVEELRKIEQKMSFFYADSDVSKINAAAGIDYADVSEETLKVIETAKEYSVISRGAFDVTIAPLVKSWGINTQDQKIPSQYEIGQLLNLVNYRDIKIDKIRSKVKLSKKGQKIDLGGIAKGYAADMAIKIYKNMQVSSAMINIGGNVMTLGNKPDNTLWQIGVQNPFGKANENAAIIAIADKSVVTSGDYQRYFEYQGKRYHHIIDPRTGHPVDTDISSATIIADKSIDADGLSTPIFMAGIKEAIDTLNKTTSVDAVLIDNKGRIYATKGLKNSFAAVNNEKRVCWI